jgi:restriction system protein
MPVPDFQSIMLPFLQVLEDGGERSMREMGDVLAARFSLTESELQRECAEKMVNSSGLKIVL